MTTAPTQRMTHPQPTSTPAGRTRPLAGAAAFLARLARCVHRGDNQAPSAASPSVDEIAFRDELMVRLGKLD
jgi:hypothetical protein